MKKVLVVASKIDLDTLSDLKKRYELGVIYMFPVEVPNDFYQDSLCRVCFTDDYLDRIDHFLTYTFEPDFILVFDCLNRVILERLYGEDCPVIKFIDEELEYCRCGHDHTQFSWWTMIPKWWCYWKRVHYVHFWQRSLALILRLKKYRKGLIAKGVSDDLLVYSGSTPLLQLLEPLLVESGV